MIIIPAIDLKGGECVRLLQGKMEKVTIFSDDPGKTAKKWEAMGAEFLHVVDLDGAFKGKPVNEKAITNILKSISIPVQLGGGIRDWDTIDNYLNLGIERVILGTAAHRNSNLVKEACRRYSGRIVVGIDARDGMVAVEGWGEITRETASDLAKKFEGYGVSAIVFTDIKRDGMLTGPNIESITDLARSINIPVIASGGVVDTDSIKNLLKIEKYGIMGIIVGRAIYDGSLDLGDAIELAGKTGELEK